MEMVVANEGWLGPSMFGHATVEFSNGRVRTMAQRQPRANDAPPAENGTAKAVLICRPNSHPFENRTVLLDQPVKIGRAVQRTHAAPAAHNAIFDCKVLSRNHATLWYENGLFYLMDNMSSNGTFVNNLRLYESGEESRPYQVSSGDIVQFGVDVVDNSEKPTTHGCVVATLKLYLPDGREADSRLDTSMPLKGLYELNKYVQEAIQRETTLESKLASLRNALEATKAAAAGGWRALASEQRLLARVRALETKLAVARRAAAGDDADAVRLLDARRKLEDCARESLRLAHEDRVAGEARLLAAQQQLRTARADATRADRAAETAQAELQRLATRCTQLDKDAVAAVGDRQRLAEALAALQRLHPQAGNSENGFANTNIDNKEISSIIEKCIKGAMNSDDDKEKKNSIIDGEENDNVALPDAIRNLPDFIKAVLPEHILQKVGCKVSATNPGHTKDLEGKLFLLKNELYNLEKQYQNKSIDTEIISNNTSVPASDKSKLELEEDGKEISEKDTSVSEINADIQSNSSASISDLSDSGKTMTLISSQDTNANNAIENSMTNNHEEEPKAEDGNYPIRNRSQIDVLRDEISKISKQIDIAAVEGPTKKIYQLQDKLSVAESQIQCLLDEVAALQQGLSRSLAENSDLRQSRNDLMADKVELQMLLLDSSERCKRLDTIISQHDGQEKGDEITESAYKEWAGDLQSRLDIADERQKESYEEIQGLKSKIYELMLDLNERIPKEQLELLNEKIASLEKALQDKEKIIDELERKFDSSMTSPAFDDVARKLNVEDRCDSPDDSSGADNVTVLENSRGELGSPGHESFSRSLSFVGHFPHIDAEMEEILKKQTETQGFNELEEELVKTKERWAAVLDENNRLACELKEVSERYHNSSAKSAANVLLYVVPIVLGILYCFFYQLIS